MEKVSVQPKGIHKPINNAYSHAIRSGKMLFIAGQLAMDQQGRVVGAGDIRKQTKQVFENIGTILKASGATFENLVYWTAFIVDMKKNYAGYAEVRAQYLSKDPKPATALVEVKGLSTPDFLFEVQAIAVLD
jgi:reactive intermediate/imine deaminase